MKNINLKQLFSLKGIYYICTLIIALLVGIIGGIVDIMQTQGVVDTAAHLGYPLYFFFLLGIFKIVGGIVLLLPRFLNRYKKIAYYGFAFDFIFASFSHYSVGDSSIKVAIPLIFLVLLCISYLLKDRN